MCVCVWQALERTWGAIKPERSNLWSAIYAATSGNYGNNGKEDAVIKRDILWNLRTWPLELIQWQVVRSRVTMSLWHLSATGS